MRGEAVEPDVADVLVQGYRVHYVRAGSRRPPLILIHGLVGSLRNWRLNIPSLARTSTVYALDLLNMGESARVPGTRLEASLHATADRIVAFMDALGIHTADIAAHSHGGAISLALAARYPDRVNRLILFAPVNPFCNVGQPLIAFYNSRLGGVVAKLIPVLPLWTKRVALRRMFGDPSRATPEILEGYTAGLSSPETVEHARSILRGWSRDMERLRHELPALARKPMLLIWGDRDRAVGLESAQQLQRVCCRSTLVVLPGVGHIPFEESPEVCNQAMLRFLESSANDPDGL